MKMLELLEHEFGVAMALSGARLARRAASRFRVSQRTPDERPARTQCLSAATDDPGVPRLTKG